MSEGTSFARVIVKFLLLLIRFYQIAISPYLGRWCRFEPSCSEYTRQALMLHGFLGGSWLGIKRICRCQPFCKGGHDPVPTLQKEKNCCGESLSTKNMTVSHG